MDRAYLSNAAQTPPSPPPSAGGYPTAGSKVSGVPATVPGPWWFHMVTEELRNVVTGFGVTPDRTATNQVFQAILNAMHPVGSVYMSTSSTNPATIFGGTWTQIKDRMLIGAGGSYAALSTGGAKTATLSVANLPSHTHTATTGSAGGHTHTGSAQSGGSHSHTTDTQGSHSHTAQSAGAHTHSEDNAGTHTHTRGTMEITGSFAGAGTSSSWASGAFYKLNQEGAIVNNSGEPDNVYGFQASRNWTGSTSSAGSHKHTINSGGAHTHSTDTKGGHTHTAQTAGAHTHTLTVNSGGSHSHTVTIASTGSGSAFSIMPPYMAVYMWYRTA